MSNERDMHFMNAAKLLVDKTMATRAMDTLDADRFLSDDEIAELQTLFAQFAYDIGEHVIAHLDSYIYDTTTGDDFFKWIPDLTEWPKTADSPDSE